MLNEVKLIGRVATDPESREFQNGGSVCNVRLATTENWKDKNTGEKKEKSEFHNVAIFGPTANFISQYVIKGDLLYVSGKLATRSWETKEGEKRYVTEVVVQGFDSKVQKLNFPDKKQKSAPGKDIDDEIPW